MMPQGVDPRAVKEMLQRQSKELQLRLDLLKARLDAKRQAAAAEQALDQMDIDMETVNLQQMQEHLKRFDSNLILPMDENVRM